MLELIDVTSYYGKTPILQNISVSVPDGLCLCVLGRNGVGKTTLLRTIMGLTTRMTGRLMIGSDDSSAWSTHLRAMAGLGYVPQGRRILGKFTVRENLVLGTFARVDRKNDIPAFCLECFPYLARNLDKPAGLLSGGEQQQLAIARALATDPKVLLLDEPTEGIQPNIVAEIEVALRRMNKELGLTMILTEQHIKIARAMSDRFVMLDTGKVVAKGEIGALTSELIETYLTI